MTTPVVHLSSRPGSDDHSRDYGGKQSVKNNSYELFIYTHF